MALPTYLELVNSVLVRMREPEVSTVNENTLSKLVGKFINDAKTQVENAYTWNALTHTLTINTIADDYGYVLTGAGQMFRVLDAQDITNKVPLTNITTADMSRYLLVSPTHGKPVFYNFNGVHTTGDMKVDLFPIPDAGLVIYFNLYIPQPKLTADSDTLLVPSDAVELGAFARAVVERGEDGGISATDAYSFFKTALADAIALESAQFCEEETWEAV